MTSSWQLYVIIDRAASGSRDLAELTTAAIRGGADAIQLRDKSASSAQLIREATRLLPVTRAAGIPLIINDRVEVVDAVGADGVHLGQDDGPIEEARRLLGSTRLIGKSTHSLEQAIAADAEGADYIGFGPIFPTPTKPAYEHVGIALIGDVTRLVHVPVVCIGGIDRPALQSVLAAGATCVAVVRAVCGAEDPQRAARQLKNALTQFVHTPVSPSL